MCVKIPISQGGRQTQGQVAELEAELEAFDSLNGERTPRALCCPLKVVCLTVVLMRSVLGKE